MNHLPHGTHDRNTRIFSTYMHMFLASKGLDAYHDGLAHTNKKSCPCVSCRSSAIPRATCTAHTCFDELLLGAWKRSLGERLISSKHKNNYRLQLQTAFLNLSCCHPKRPSAVCGRWKGPLVSFYIMITSNHHFVKTLL